MTQEEIRVSWLGGESYKALNRNPIVPTHPTPAALTTDDEDDSDVILMMKQIMNKDFEKEYPIVPTHPTLAALTTDDEDDGDVILTCNEDGDDEDDQ